MPFTLCHPALVMPLHRCARRWTSLSALVIGSMAPDFVYFLPLGVGAASHLAWDAFTHANTVVVQHVGVLRTPVTLGGRVVPLYKILQHLSSLLGFLVLAASAAVWYRRTEPVPPTGRRPGARQRHLILAALAAAPAAGGTAGLLWRDARSIEHALFNVVTTGMAATALAILLLCLGWRIRYRAASKRAAKSTG